MENIFKQFQIFEHILWDKAPSTVYFATDQQYVAKPAARRLLDLKIGFTSKRVNSLFLDLIIFDDSLVIISKMSWFELSGWLSYEDKSLINCTRSR